MPHITISDIGPVDHIDIELNRFNVFIGPQGSGKSTIAKIVSFCQWLEKDCLKRQITSHADADFIDTQLVKYHNMEGYISEKSTFHYTGDAINIEMKNGAFSITRTEQFSTSLFSKNAYIPAERNIISIPGIFATKMPDNNILDFIDQWQTVRGKYKDGNRVPLLDLDQSYTYDNENNRDLVINDITGKSFVLSHVSSGLQSVTPLCVMIDYLTGWIYSYEEECSAEDRETFRYAALSRLLAEKTGKSHLLELSKQDKNIRKAIDFIYEAMQHVPVKPYPDTETEKQVAELQKLEASYSHPAFSNIVIEEPELNLFPTTQVHLLYYLLSRIDHNRDRLTLTTHSPYILYALNNCILAGKAFSSDDTIPYREMTDIPEKAWLDASKVSVWELAEGKIRNGSTIQDESGLIRDNYFDRIMHNVMVDFRNMLNFID